MPAPAHVKTWQYSLNNLIPSNNAIVERKTAARTFVNVLTGFATNPLTVSGSSNGVAFGMDGVNRWVTDADLVNGSWIVLRDAQVNPKFEICLFISANITASAFTMSFTVSRLAGFGTVNGGTNGTATTRPTATDEDPALGTSTTWLVNTTPKVYRLYFWRSSDGQFTRFLARNATDGTWANHFFWGRPKAGGGGIPDLWTDPCYWSLLTVFAGVDSTSIRFAKGSTLITSLAQVFSVARTSVATWNQADGLRAGSVFPNFEIKLSTTSVGSECPDMGSVWDAYSVSALFGQGDMEPATGTKTWATYVPVSGNSWLLPHDNSALSFGPV